jgi:ankyrin repeat protein
MTNNEKDVFELIAENNITEIEELLNQDKNLISAKNQYKSSLLHCAVKKGKKEIIELLIEKGANVNVKDEYEKTTLHWAIFKGNKEIIELLIEKGVDVNLQNKRGVSPLHMIPFNKKNTDISKLLIRNGADINAKDQNQKTPLINAAENGHKEIVELLIENGADINAKDSVGLSALHIAARMGHKDIIEFLLENGADVNMKDERGETPLHYAGNQPDILKLLIEGGCNVNLQDKIGNIKLHYVLYRNQPDIVKLLIEGGSNVNLQDHTRKKPLLYAAQKGKHEIVRLLIKSGKCDLSVKNNENNDIWTYYHDDPEMTELLMKYGAQYRSVDENLNVGNIINSTQSVHSESKKAKEIYDKHKDNIDQEGAENLKKVLEERIETILDKPDFQGQIAELIIAKEKDVGQGQGTKFVNEIKARIKEIEGKDQSFDLSTESLINYFSDNKFKDFIKRQIMDGIKYCFETIKDSKPFNDIDGKVNDFLSILHESLKDNPNKEDYYSNILVQLLDAKTMYGSGGAACATGFVNKLINEACLGLFDEEEVKKTKSEFEFENFQVDFSALMDLLVEDKIIEDKKKLNLEISQISFTNLEVQELAKVLYNFLKFEDGLYNDFPNIIYYGMDTNIFIDKNEPDIEKIKEFRNKITYKHISDLVYKKLFNNKEESWKIDQNTGINSWPFLNQDEHNIAIKNAMSQKDKYQEMLVKQLKAIKEADEEKANNLDSKTLSDIEPNKDMQMIDKTQMDLTGQIDSDSDC